MPDITKCVNEDCQDRLICYRFLVRPSEKQSYARFEPDKKTGLCKDYLEIYGDYWSYDKKRSITHES